MIQINAFTMSFFKVSLLTWSLIHRHLTDVETFGLWLVRQCITGDGSIINGYK